MPALTVSTIPQHRASDQDADELRKRLSGDGAYAIPALILNGTEGSSVPYLLVELSC